VRPSRWNRPSTRCRSAHTCVRRQALLGNNSAAHSGA
jgi:hypothetical protein